MQSAICLQIVLIEICWCENSIVCIIMVLHLCAFSFRWINASLTKWNESSIGIIASVWMQWLKKTLLKPWNVKQNVSKLEFFRIKRHLCWNLWMDFCIFTNKRVVEEQWNFSDYFPHFLNLMAHFWNLWKMWRRVWYCDWNSTLRETMIHRHQPTNDCQNQATLKDLKQQ